MDQKPTARQILSPKDMAMAMLTSLEQEYGKTGFCQKFDVIEGIVRQLFVEAKEELEFQREEAKRKINKAEEDVASMMSLFQHFKTSFHGDLEEILNPKEVADRSKLNR